MTEKQRSDTAYYKSAKVRTFYKGDEFYEVIAWIMEQIETVDVGATGCHVARKYAVSVKILNEERKCYKPKR